MIEYWMNRRRCGVSIVAEVECDQAVNCLVPVTMPPLVTLMPFSIMTAPVLAVRRTSTTSPKPLYHEC
jgi:hypothetical protein